MLTFNSSSSSHVGMVRQLNEDSFISRDDIGLWAVADGMGGHQAGDVASQQVTTCLKAVSPSTDIEELHQATKQALRTANSTLLSHSEEYDSARPPGSTVVALLVNETKAVAVWAGDSRVYRFRDGVVQQITVDHSHVQDLVREGLIREDEAESHPMANVITRAIGIEEPVELDSVRLSVAPGDRFLLCSDGLSRLVSNEEMIQLMQTVDIQDSVHSLLHTALVRGAPDNVTLICVECSGVGGGDEEATIV
jgi:serine/threonine-protein phosphatase Stp1